MEKAETDYYKSKHVQISHSRPTQPSDQSTSRLREVEKSARIKGLNKETREKCLKKLKESIEKNMKATNDVMKDEILDEMSGNVEFKCFQESKYVHSYKSKVLSVVKDIDRKTNNQERWQQMMNSIKTDS